MASLEEHKIDCLRWVGNPCEEVHRWLDEFLPTLGAQHRRMRHHREGVEEARRIFGDLGAAAAIVHILRDCRQVPRARDYQEAAVDPLGLKSEWPVAAYARYTEEAFSALVENELQGPLGVILWAFFQSPSDLDAILRSATHLTEEQRAGCVARWPEVSGRVKELPPIQPIEPKLRSATSKALEHFRSFSEQPAFKQLEQTGAKPQLGFLEPSPLVCPFALLDYEYVEELRATLEGDDEASLARFAVPAAASTPVKVMSDGRSVTLVSASKTLLVAGVDVKASTPAWVEVRFLVANDVQPILVSHVAGRLFLRGGIHRAFLLLSMGVREMPCLLTHEAHVPIVTGAYPAFTPIILARPRPPLLSDALNEELSLKAPIQRTHKVIRISVEDMIIPVD